MSRTSPLIAFLLIALPSMQGISSAQAAETSSPVREPEELDRVVVVASKAPEPVAQVVGSVGVIDRETLERRQTRTIADLVRYEPGLDATGDSTRFGWQGFSIRGLDGNRVSLEIDGVPVAEAFSVGQFAAAGRDLVEMEAIERVEFLRGPASTLYGSDALAGVVAYRTRSPQDLLMRVDSEDARYFGGRLGWSGRDRSRSGSAAFAAGNADGRVQGMVVAARRQGHETENHSAARPANPADMHRDSVLAKLVWDAGDWGRWTAALEHGAGRMQTDVRSLRFGPGRFSTTTELLGDDRYRRDRLSLKGEWTHRDTWLDRSELLLYTQRSDTDQDTAQTRLADRTTRFPSLRLREFDFEQRATGLKWLGEARSGDGAVRHWHVFGMEYARTTYEGSRDGVEINLNTGTRSNVILGERFPVRDFPNSVARETGVFWQDEIGIGERFALVPGLRWERYDLDANPDAMFREDYPTVAVSDIRRDSWSPKLGMRWKAGERSTVFAQYVRGFRAPPFSDVNIGLTLTGLNYVVRPNPDLRPERSRGFEAGWRWQNEGLRASVSAYSNRYRDLIDSRANLGVDPVTGALVFQSVNRARAKIEGLEAEAQWTPDANGDWQLRAAAAWARGRDLARDQPLNSVAPGKLVLGASWEPAASHWGLEAAATAVARQSSLDESTGPLFHAPGHALFDVYAWWRPHERVRVNLAAQNLGDRRYWDWTAVRGLSATAADREFYTRPGRNFAVSVSFDW